MFKWIYVQKEHFFEISNQGNRKNCFLYREFGSKRVIATSSRFRGAKQLMWFPLRTFLGISNGSCTLPTVAVAALRWNNGAKNLTKLSSIKYILFTFCRKLPRCRPSTSTFLFKKLDLNAVWSILLNMINFAGVANRKKTLLLLQTRTREEWGGTWQMKECQNYERQLKRNISCSSGGVMDLSDMKAAQPSQNWQGEVQGGIAIQRVKPRVINQPLTRPTSARSECWF